MIGIPSLVFPLNISCSPAALRRADMQISYSAASHAG